MHRVKTFFGFKVIFFTRNGKDYKNEFLQN